MFFYTLQDYLGLTIVTSDMHFISLLIHDQLLRAFATKNFKLVSSIDAKETKLAFKF